MSKFRDLIIDIQDDILANVLTFSQISEKHDVTVDFVAQVYCEMLEQELSI
jgi:hypothetical protein